MDRGHALVASLAETWNSMRSVCLELDDAAWTTPTACPGWDVHDNVAHILGIEQMLEGDALPEVALADELEHVKNDFGRINEMWVESYRSVSHAELMSAFDSVTKRRLDRFGALDAAGFVAPSWTPQGEGTVLDLLPFRIFDAWCHEQDIREATGRPGGWHTAAAALSVERMLNSLPYVVGKRAGMPEGFTISFRLTGDQGCERTVAVTGGRGSFVDASGNVDVTITMPTTAFMRYSLGRTAWTADTPEVQCSGDLDGASRVLQQLNVLF